jgi:hypothetical protein
MTTPKRGGAITLYIPHLSAEERKATERRLRALSAALGYTVVSGERAGDGAIARLLLALDEAYRQDRAGTETALRELLARIR